MYSYLLNYFVLVGLHMGFTVRRNGNLHWLTMKNQKHLEPPPRYSALHAVLHDSIMLLSGQHASDWLCIIVAINWQHFFPSCLVPAGNKQLFLCIPIQ
jgi:hypothetical protein